MGKFRENSELGFFFLWLWIYLMAQSAGGLLSRTVGVRYLGTALLDLALAVFLWVWLNRQGLADRYGLCHVQAPMRVLLWLLPPAVLASSNLWNGVALRSPLGEILFAVLTMACVAFLEELLLRGFLFRYLKERSVRTAVVVSSLVFSGAHGLNLLSEENLGLMGSGMQVAGALCFGLMCAVLLLRSGSLWPCILTHGAVNVLSVFGRSAGAGRILLLFWIQMALMLGYTAYLIRTHRETTYH